MILLDTWIYTPFVILVLYGGICSVPQSHFQAAQLEGVTQLRYLLQFLLPSLKPYMTFAFCFCFLDSLNQFEVIYLGRGGGSMDGPMNLPLLAYHTAFSWDLGSALLYLALLLPFLLLATLFLWQWFS